MQIARLPEYPSHQAELRHLSKKAERLAAHPSEPPLCSWNEAVEIAQRCALGDFTRDPALERLYRREFKAAVLKYYDTMSACVLRRLGWDRPPDPPLPAELFCFSADLEHESHVRIVWNEWPYSVDPSMTHAVVWTRLPIFHASQHPTPAEIANGYSGFSWLPQQDSPASAELGKFVRKRWDPAKYEVIWFANPPILQSIRDVSHFHVMIRDRH